MQMIAVAIIAQLIAWQPICIIFSLDIIFSLVGVEPTNVLVTHYWLAGL